MVVWFLGRTSSLSFLWSNFGLDLWKIADVMEEEQMESDFLFG